MNEVTALFGFACLGALAFTSGTRACLAWAMVCVWSAANLLWLHDLNDYLPLIDLPMAVTGYILMLDRPEGWRVPFAAAFGLRMPLHVGVAWQCLSFEAYAHIINAAFLAALVAISWEGGSRVFGDCLWYIRRLRGLVAQARLARSKAS